MWSLNVTYLCGGVSECDSVVSQCFASYVLRVFQLTLVPITRIHITRFPMMRIVLLLLPVHAFPLFFYNGNEYNAINKMYNYIYLYMYTYI